MKTYTFRVSLEQMDETWRLIELREDQTLQDLHYAIQEAFAWEADHLYSFFMSGKASEQKQGVLPARGDRPVRRLHCRCLRRRGRGRKGGVLAGIGKLPTEQRTDLIKSIADRRDCPTRGSARIDFQEA